MDKQVLVLDDDPSITSLLKDLLEDENYKVFTSNDGFEAIKIFTDNNLKMAFVDLQMPGMNGLDFCKRIRQVHENVWICSITGVSELFKMNTCFECGFNNYLTKPLDLEKLIEVANSAYERLCMWN